MTIVMVRKRRLRMRSPSLPYSSFFFDGEIFEVGECVVRGQIGLQRGDRDVAIPNRLVVGAIMRFPLVLALFDPVVRTALGIVALGHRRHMVALRLHSDAI